MPHRLHAALVAALLMALTCMTASTAWASDAVSNHVINACVNKTLKNLGITRAQAKSLPPGTHITVEPNGVTVDSRLKRYDPRNAFGTVWWQCAHVAGLADAFKTRDQTIAKLNTKVEGSAGEIAGLRADLKKAKSELQKMVADAHKPTAKAVVSSELTLFRNSPILAGVFIALVAGLLVCIVIIVSLLGRLRKRATDA